MSVKIITALGTRPELIKLAPLIRLFEQQDGVLHSVCLSGQHQAEMLDLYDFFEISTPKFQLREFMPSLSLARNFSEISMEFSDLLQNELPELVVVHGDTITALACAYSAFLNQIPVAHVEAGLRTYDLTQPFPEEMCRQQIARLAKYNYAPTEKNRLNLLSENVQGEILVTGNTGLDSLDFTRRKLQNCGNISSTFDHRMLSVGSLDQKLQNSPDLVMITLHRRENLSRMTEIFSTIREFAQVYPHLTFAFPLHPNPQIRELASIELNSTRNIYLLESLPYLEMVRLLEISQFIVTDSGGIQEEAVFLGKPVLVVRDRTERNPENYTGLRLESNYPDLMSALEDMEGHSNWAVEPKPSFEFGDGSAALRIVTDLLERVGVQA